MKKTVSFLLAVIIITVQLTAGISALPFKASAAETDYKCGDNVTWYLDTDGVLTISGTGSTYEFNNDAPWEAYSSSIYSVKVEEGVTRLGQHAFYNCKNIKSVHLAASVETVHFSALPTSVEEITVAENSMLTEFRIESDYFKRSKWYKNQADDEPIYLGRLLVGVPSSFSLSHVEIKSGTYAVNMKAFRDCMVTEFSFPDSLCFIGWGAFDGTAWLDAQADGPVYAGNVFLCYKGLLPLEESNYVISEGTTGIAAQAFYDQDRLNSISISSSVKYIGYDAFSGCINLSEVNFADNSELIGLDTNAFYECKCLKNIILPDSLQIIGSSAFSKTAITVLYIPKNVKTIYNNIGNIDSGSSISRYTVDENNNYFCNDEYGVLYSKDMTLLCDYPRCADIEEYTVNVQCKRIKQRAFYNTFYTNSVIVNNGCETIEGWQFNSSSVENITIPVTVSDINGLSEKQTIYCYENSFAHEFAVENQYNYILIEVVIDSEKLEGLVSLAEDVDRTLYTESSLALLDEVLNTIDLDKENLTQSQVTEWEQAIETAIENLEYLPADYSSVEAQLEKVNVLDRRYYSEISLVALDNAVKAVEYGLNITEQAKADAYAQAIADALANLAYASIVLRHEPCGVIVSATTKEIKPDTVLTVEEVDPSNYEGTNFAVGGSIRSLHFYDINLVLGSEKVQPEGTVTVKIKLADGVNPAKCKVYHVTEDIVNPLVRFASTIDGNYIVFETTHFSEFAVIEVETVLDGIEITKQPDKTDYTAGESLDTEGMKVVARFSDGTSKEISDYTVGMVNLNAAGTHKVTVYYTFGSTTKTAEFEVNVAAKEITADITENGKSTEAINKKLSLFSFYSRAAIQLECASENADGCTLRWSSDNSKVMVDENGRVTCKGLFGAKKANITVEILDGNGKVVASDTVRVIFYKFSFQLSNAVSQAIETIRREY